MPAPNWAINESALSLAAAPTLHPVIGDGIVAATVDRNFREFERLDHCPGCGSERINDAYELDIGQCAVCALLFRNPRPTQAEIARSYDTGGTFDAWQEQEAARAAMWNRRLEVVRRFQPQGRVLDVGTGDGRFLQTCRAHGYDVMGTEVSQAGAAYAQHSGLNVRMGQITELDLPKESFDVATIWHVLEHVPDPGAVLRKVFTLLRPGAVLAVAVPNEENYFVRQTLRLPIAASPFDRLQFGGEIHLTYFRPVTLRSTLCFAGLEVLEFGVDDLYQVRNAKMEAKLALQRLLARRLGWHFAVAMYAICRRPTTSSFDS